MAHQIKNCLPNRSGRAAAVFLLAVLFAHHLLAQEGPPRFLLTAENPVGTIRSLVFTPDSQQILVGGSNKYVSLYNIRRAGVEQPWKLALAERLYWEISRGARGHIYAMAVAPSGNQLVVGGYSARDATGDLHLFNLKTLDWERLLRGHKQTVETLTYSPDGKWLLSISKDGEGRLWNTETWTNQSLDGLGTSLSDNRPALFLSNTTVVIGAHGADPRLWHLAQYDVTTRQMRRLAQPHLGRVEALALNKATGQLASSDRNGEVWLWDRSLAGRPEKLRQGRIASAMAFSKDFLFLTTIRDAQGVSHLEMWNPRTKQLVDERPLATGDDTFACAVSPNQEYLAASAEQGTIALLPLRDGAGKLLEKPLTQGDLFSTAKNSQKVWHVAFEQGKSYQLALGSKPRPAANWDELRGQLTSAFDLTKVQAVNLAAHRAGWRTPQTNAQGWRATPLDGGRKVEIAQGANRAVITLDAAYQGPAECYTWLHNEQGQPYAIALGTSQQYGIFVYALPVNGQCRLLRYYRDHYGTVTSLSCSTDGKYLASSSLDGTAKIWSLQNLLDPGDGFRPAGAWGGKFRKKDAQRLVVESVDPAGIMARRELSVGDNVINVIYENKGQAANADTADSMFTALEQSSLWQSVVLSVIPQGETKTKRILLVPAWEPLASLVMDQAGEWVMWTPQGYYDASAAGDELIGWIINGSSARPAARFFRADRFRKQLEKPEILQKLLAARNLPGAFNQAKLVAPKQLQDRITDIALRLPSIKILQPTHNQVIERGKNIVTQASIEFPNPADMPKFQAALYINGIPSQKPTKQVQNNTVVYQWETPPPNTDNELRIIAEQRQDDEQGDYSDARIQVRAEVTPPKARLHFVGLASIDYPGNLRLAYCIDDLQSVQQSLAAASGKFYDMPQKNILVRTDHAITKESVNRLPQDLESQTGPLSARDVLVIYLAGHGVALSSVNGSDYYYIPPNKQITTFDPDLIRDKAIAWESLQKLAELPCRKVFLVDTCQQSTSNLFGEAALNMENAIRPLRRRETLVLTSCGLGQQAFEPGVYRQGDHSFFAKAVLEGLGGLADGWGDGGTRFRKDRCVDLQELVSYVRQRVPALVELEDRVQIPTVSNSRLGYLPLISY